jgi:hypothetical protein
MVQDYVPPLIADLLDEKYHKVKQQVEENPPSAKKPKIGISEPLEDYSNKTDHHHIMPVKVNVIKYSMLVCCCFSFLYRLYQNYLQLKRH